MFCSKCGNDKEKNKRCKNCAKIYHKQYRTKNRTKLVEYSLNYYQNNKEKYIEYKDLNREKIRIYNNNLERIRKQIDPSFKLRKNCARLIKHALKNGNKNNMSILKYLPYTMGDLKNHLEIQFDNKMSWDNYGSYWHIDHIYPQSKLPYTSMEDENFKKCWALDNLRPLEKIENIKKSNKIVGLNVH